MTRWPICSSGLCLFRVSKCLHHKNTEVLFKGDFTCENHKSDGWFNTITMALGGKPLNRHDVMMISGPSTRGFSSSPTNETPNWIIKEYECLKCYLCVHIR